MSKNDNIAFQFEFQDDRTGILRLIDRRIDRTTDGTFQLDYSEEQKKWFINLDCPVTIKTAAGNFPLLGVFVENLTEYINKISN